MVKKAESCGESWMALIIPKNPKTIVQAKTETVRHESVSTRRFATPEAFAKFGFKFEKLFPSFLRRRESGAIGFGTIYKLQKLIFRISACAGMKDEEFLNVFKFCKGLGPYLLYLKKSS